MQETFASRSLDKFVLRMPDGMRARISEAAKTSKRTMNAEIVARLERSFASEPDSSEGAADARSKLAAARLLAMAPDQSQTAQRLASMESLLRELEGKLNQLLSAAGSTGAQ